MRFEAVHFAYGGEDDVLRDLDLVIEPGEIVAVCGPTGSGKTSLLNLLPRFYDPTGGSVLVGGIDTRDLPIAELRADVALVTQRPVLFSVPLRENLTAGREDADWDEVLAACEAAGVDAFADELPDGYDTLIGERGVNLSGGQRQRVALARALVTGARVVVLDDPLSAVDTLTERRLVKRLRPALEGTTVLVATQRLSTVELADRAVVLVDGRIVESGTPRDLLRAGGRVRGALRRRGRGRVKRLWRYLEGRKAWAAVLVLVGDRQRRRQTGGWLLVRNAIDKGIRARDEHHLTIVVAIYLGVAAVGWVLQAGLIRGLAGLGQRMVLGLRRDLFDHLTGLSLRYFSQQKAGWIIARLTSDVDAVSDVLSQGMPTLVANVILLPAAVIALLDRRLAPRARRLRDRPAGARADALVPADVARRARRDAQPDRRRHRADRGVGLRHGGRAGVQPRAPRSRRSSTS